jgi:hypothetical protein
LFKFLKIVFAAPFLSIRLQQRGKIMKRYLHLVKRFLQNSFPLFLPTPPPETPAPQ